MSSARTLVEELNSGALPAQLILSNEEKVAPTL
jgi:preprotein translocase subunit SecD